MFYEIVGSGKPVLIGLSLVGLAQVAR